MNIETIGVIGGFFITIGGGLIMFGSLKNKLENACERQKEDRDSHAMLHEKEHEESREKFKELYESRNSTNEALVKLSTLVEQIFNQLGTINEKIDKALK